MNLRCPVTGERCAYREALPQIFTTVDISDSNPVCPNPAQDGAKLHVRLAEHQAAAIATGCTGMTEQQTCPTADRMAASPARRGLRQILRLAIG